MVKREVWMMETERISSFFKKTWYVLLITAIAMVANYLMVKDLQQLPSPIFGGDYWNHLGIMYHIKYGGSVFDSGQLLGEIPWVPRLYHLYNLALSFISGLDPMKANILNSIFLIPLSAYAIWYLTKRFTENKIIIATSIILFLASFPFFKYTMFAYYVMAPILLVAWFLYLDQPNNQRLILLAVVMGLCALAQTQLFFATFILFGVVFLERAYCFIKVEKRKIGLNQETISEFKPFAIIFIISFLISLIYWFTPIFIYKVHTPNDLQIYGWADFTKLDLQLTYPLERLYSTFVETGNLFWGLIKLSMLAGALVVIKKRSDKKYRFAFLILVAALIGLFHHLLSFNLFHIQLAPERIYSMFMTAFSVMILAIGLDEGVKRFKNIGSYLPYLSILLVLVLFNSNFAYWNNPSKGSYEAGARTSMSAEFVELRSWILNNTKVNDVFLTDNEDAFMMNGLTGRKSVSYRRTHTSTFADLDQRNLDSTVMLYGSNETTRTELMKKYKVKYVLWTAQWFRNQITVENNQIKGMFDPFMSKDSYANKYYLQNNNVSFVNIHYYLDPAFQKTYPTYDLIIVPPQGKSVQRPWSEGFDSHLTELYRIEFKGAPSNYPSFAVIYGVSYD